MDTPKMFFITFDSGLYKIFGSSGEYVIIEAANKIAKIIEKTPINSINLFFRNFLTTTKTVSSYAIRINYLTLYH